MTVLSIPRSLVPLRIAHHPNVVLEVVLAEKNQDADDNLSAGSQSIDNHLVHENLEAINPSLEVVPAADNQALVVRSQGHLGVKADEWLLASNTSHSQERTRNETTLQEQLHLLRQQMEDALGKMQQTDEQAQSTQQRLQDQIDKILQSSEQMDRQHIDEVQRMMQQSDLHTRQFEEVLQTMQQHNEEMMEQFDQKAQVFQQQTHATQHQLEQIKQEHQFLQLLQSLFEEILQKIQQPDQLKQHLDELLQSSHQKLQQQLDQLTDSERLNRQDIDETRGHIRQLLPRMQKLEEDLQKMKRQAQESQRCQQRPTEHFLIGFLRLLKDTLCEVLEVIVVVIAVFTFFVLYGIFCIGKYILSFL